MCVYVYIPTAAVTAGQGEAAGAGVCAAGAGGRTAGGGPQTPQDIVEKHKNKEEAADEDTPLSPLTGNERTPIRGDRGVSSSAASNTSNTGDERTPLTSTHL